MKIWEYPYESVNKKYWEHFYAYYARAVILVTLLKKL